METLPLISVVVPVYNVAPYLDRCLASITGQSYRNLEILVVDDGSTDGSAAICDAWAARDSRVQVLHQRNAGAGQARNAALAIARGELIGLVDSDDYIAPEMYRHLYSLMERQQADIAECDIAITEGDSCPLEDGEGAKVTVCITEAALRCQIREEMFQQTPPNKLYRRETVDGISFPVGNLIDDEFWTYRVIGRARKLAHSDAKMYAYRQSPGSAMRRPYTARRLQGLDAKLERLAYLREHFPALEDEAKYDLMMSCLFYMQSVQRHLTGPERQAAEEKILAVARELKPVRPDPEAPARRKLLLRAACLSLRGTGRVLNLLTNLGVLD